MQESQTVKKFFEKLNKIPQLTHENCIELFKQNNKSSRQKIAESNLRLVVSIAKRYLRKNKDIPIEDLIQEGNVGLMTAIDRFEWERGLQFSTYATYWIQQAIGAYITTKKYTIRRPTHAIKLNKNIIEAKKKYVAEHNCEPSDQELMQLVNASEKMLNATKFSKYEIVGLTETPYMPGLNVFDTNGNTTYEQKIADESDNSDPDFCHFSKELTSIIQKVLTSLSPKEEKILRLRFGLSEVDDGNNEFLVENDD